MNKVNIEGLKNSFHENNLGLSDVSKQGIILFMSLPDGGKEIIVNPDGLEKIKFIEEKYDQDLIMKSNNDIKILNFAFFNNEDVNASLPLSFLKTMIENI